MKTKKWYMKTLNFGEPVNSKERLAVLLGGLK